MSVRTRYRRFVPAASLFASWWWSVILPAHAGSCIRNTVLPRAGRPGQAQALAFTRRIAVICPPSGVGEAAQAQVLFARDIATGLHTVFGAGVVPDNEVADALRAVRQDSSRALSPHDSLTLCSRLGCDAVIQPAIANVTVRRRTDEVVVLRATVRIGGPRFPPPQRRRARGRQRSTAGSGPPPEDLTISAYGTCSHVLFGRRYTKTTAQLVSGAAQQAANLTLHALSTDRIAPFMDPRDRVVVAPVTSPRSADTLEFSPSGRHVVPDLVADLPADVSGFFAPNLLPVLPDAVIGGPRSARALANLGFTPSAMWCGEDRPAVASAQSLGRATGASYVLLAHVTDIDVEQWPRDSGAAAPITEVSPDPAPARAGKPVSWMRRGGAEAAGALVRVSDGAVLWRDHVSATLTEDAAPRVVAMAAVRYALLDLQRKFSRYREAFAH